VTAYGPPELMAVAMARLLRAGEVVFQGVNSPLPMVGIALARRLHAPGLVYLNISGGIDPAPRYLPLSTTDPELAHGTASLFNNEDFYDLCARGGVDTAFLGAVQIDAAGRTNVSVIGPHARPKVRLPGGGGAAMILPTARRVILWRTQHTPRVFVERLDFVTAAGNVDRVVTPLGVLQRREGRLVAEALYPGVSAAEIAAQTGFALDIAPDAADYPPPAPAELAALDAVDPERVRDLEFHS
jgi:glutaconate CoA-transferase subunit B